MLVRAAAAPGAARSRRARWSARRRRSAPASPMSPMAIIARWRMPPENSCGYWRARRSAAGTRTARSRSTARANAGRGQAVVLRGDLGELAPIRRVGLNEVIGSWKTMAKRRCRAAAGAAARRAGPAARARGTRAGRRDTARRLEQAARPPARSGSCPSRTRRRHRRPRPRRSRADAAHGRDQPPLGRGNVTRRSRTSSTVAPPPAGRVGRRRTAVGEALRRAPTGGAPSTAEDLRRGLAEQVEREAGDHDGDPRGQRRRRMDVDRRSGRR